MNKEIDERIKYLESIFPYSYRTANYLINVSNKYKYIYFETPKVACSTIKKTLQLLEVDGDREKLPDDVHEKHSTPLLSPMQLVKPLSHHIETHFTFGFVRNPYSRILSCYLDKIIGNQWEKDRRLPKIGYDPSDELTFVEFLNAIKTYPIAEWDIHWLPQVALLAHDKIDLDFIGRQERFDSDFKQVLHYVNGGEKTAGEIVNVNHHSVGANKKLEKYLDNESEALIKEIYYDDFRAYGYDLDPYFV